MVIAMVDLIAKTKEYKSAHGKSRSKKYKKMVRVAAYLQWRILKKMNMV